jgi:hypothetical protein
LAYGVRLESAYTARYRGFESRPLRYTPRVLHDSLRCARECFTTTLRYNLDMCQRYRLACRSHLCWMLKSSHLGSKLCNSGYANTFTIIR